MSTHINASPWSTVCIHMDDRLCSMRNPMVGILLLFYYSVEDSGGVRFETLELDASVTQNLTSLASSTLFGVVSVYSNCPCATEPCTVSLVDPGVRQRLGIPKYAISRRRPPTPRGFHRGCNRRSTPNTTIAQAVPNT